MIKNIFKATISISLLFSCQNSSTKEHSKNSCKEVLATKINLKEFDKVKLNIEGLKNCGLSKEEINFVKDPRILGQLMIEIHSKNDLTYQDLVNKISKMRELPEFNETVKSFNFISQFEDKSKTKVNSSENAESINNLFTVKEFNYNLEELTSISSKPKLLYFTGYGCVNNRQFESRINNRTTDLNFIDNNYLVYNLYIDSKTPLDKNEIESYKLKNKSINTIGKKYFDFQKEFNSGTLPCFVVITPNGNQFVQESCDPTEVISFLKQKATN